MKYRALVVDDDDYIREVVADVLASLGHAHDAAATQDEARKLLRGGKYAYVLLDLQIPVKDGSFARIQNGQNLLAEIRKTPGMERTPVIIMTGHGKDGPDLAVQMMKMGATDYVTKPFPSTGATLDKAILEALATEPVAVQSDRTDGKAPRARKEPPAPSTPQAFTGGEMVVYADRAEVDGVVIISDKGTGQGLELLRLLGVQDARGRNVRLSLQKLKKALDASADGVITGCMRTIRKNAKERLLKHAALVCGDDDLVVRDEQGYHINDRVAVRVVETEETEPKAASEEAG